MGLTAGVAILKNSRAVDRIFDYSVPDAFKEDIRVGSRVIVPFGKSNSSNEGYVLYLKDFSENNIKLKDILQLTGDVLFDQKGAELIEYIRRTTVCTYAEAIGLIIPPGYKTVFKERLFVKKDCDTEKYEQMPAYRRVIEACGDKGCSLSKIEKQFGKEGIGAANDLLRAGIIIKRTGAFEKTSEKTQKILKIKDKKAAEDSIETLLKRSKKQTDIVLYLLANSLCAPALQVYEETGTSAAAAAALKKKDIIEITEERIWRSPVSKDFENEKDFDFTPQQKNAYEKIEKALTDQKNEKFLLHGVTGSGKTEVFIHVVRKCLQLGKTAIVLVPEISLTPLMTRRFAQRFSKNIAILHSRLSSGERLDEWERIKNGGAKVVLGARSAVFAPADNIGAIIIDEEHELSYKSESAPRYHARDIAFFKANQHNACVVMASATPSVESYYKAEKGEYVLLEMTNRFNKNPMPQVYVADMRKELENGNKSMFSNRLADEILYNKAHGEQTILLLNRRGFSTFVSCRECGFVASCPHCNISLTYHKKENRLTCHYCGYTIKNYSVCPSCNSKYIKYFGAGTQRLEEEMNTRFEDIKTIRMDVDTTAKKNAHEKILGAFERGEADVLMGTQMVSKGHDFPKVTLVGVMAADASLYIDDYRSGEKTFSLLEQVIGRAGRKDLEGRAVIQTYSPENNVISYAAKHDYKGFYSEEIKMRKIMYYPPFCQIGSILLSGTDEGEVKSCIERMAAWLKRRTSERKDVVILGPAPSAIGKIMDKYRYRIIMKYKGSADEIFHEIQNGFLKAGYNKTMTLALDKNPVNLS